MLAVPRRGGWLPLEAAALPFAMAPTRNPQDKCAAGGYDGRESSMSSENQRAICRIASAKPSKSAD
jgi:hypothetical protein